MKYAEYLCESLKTVERYTHCYFVAGGNIMHLLDAARTRFKCIPVVNEIAAGIAAEYFNESSSSNEKAFVLVTAGPGLTNVVTAIAGAYLESRDLLIIGGQVKTSDLKSNGLRQRGIQELDGRAIVEPITNNSVRLMEPKDFSFIQELLHSAIRPGPNFVEIPLDIQATSTKLEVAQTFAEDESNFIDLVSAEIMDELLMEFSKSERPVILLGGGLERSAANALNKKLIDSGLPIMTTYNGADRYGSDQPNYWGRPNTWGQRAANILIQQSDLILALGTRLGIQQTGFAWAEFAPVAKVFQIDIDRSELEKGHPKIFRGLAADAALFLEAFLGRYKSSSEKYSEWRAFGSKVREAFPLNDSKNETAPGYISPFEFVGELSNQLSNKDVVIPCSSGGAFTVMLQAFEQKFGQKIISNKGLASMGYGLSGAIGASESTKARTILVEGDGGFAQNLQELGTVREQNPNLKIFLFANHGYASIRMTQRNYFGGAYMGCDIETGLGLPVWEHIAKAYGIPYFELFNKETISRELGNILESDGPSLAVVRIDPEQTYYPKISSHITAEGGMASNPLHLMSPDLSSDEIAKFLPYIFKQSQERG
jgi:acetolactate synthase I/II/III large subunit